MTDYNRPSKETERQTKAWRTGALKAVLMLLIKDFGKDKVMKELDGLKEEQEITFQF